MDKPRLKLKRLIVKDLKINPHINPDAAPVPQAVPLSEPDPEPIVANIGAETISRIPRPEEKKPAQPLQISPAEQSNSSKERSATKPGKPATPAPRATAKPQPAPKSGRKAPKSKTPAKRKGKKLLFPMLLILGSLGYGIHILFDPLGLKSKPIVPVEVPAQPAQEPVNAEPFPPQESIEITQDFADVSTVDVSVYLEKLTLQDLKLSIKPKGIYINQVFYTEGMPLNPSVGLTLDSIETSTENPSFTIADQAGETYTIPIP